MVIIQNIQFGVPIFEDVLSEVKEAGDLWEMKVLIVQYFDSVNGNNYEGEFIAITSDNGNISKR